jgi:hypothetical protein
MAAIRAGQGLLVGASPVWALRSQATRALLGRPRHQCALSLQRRLLPASFSRLEGRAWLLKLGRFSRL